MKGTATITTRTTVTPVTVTEVKNGTVVVRSGAGIIVRTDEGVKSFTQGDVDKRGVKIVRDGKPVQLSELREGDRLSAMIITSLPPKVMTEREVNATLAAANGLRRVGGAGRSRIGTGPLGIVRAHLGTRGHDGTSATRRQAPARQPASASAARTLPKTASSWPLVGLVSALSLAIGFALTLRRRLA